MASTNFVTGTTITSDWANDVDNAVYQANSDISGATARTLLSKVADTISVKDFGATGNGTSNDYTSIAAAISYSTTYGGNVYFPAAASGLYGTQSQITLPDRVALTGANTRAAGIVARAGFTGSWILNAVSGTSAMFDARISNMTISGNDIAGVGGILSDAWQENSGAHRCLIQKFRTYGIKFQNGYGGASSCVISECEIFGSSVAAATAGIRVEEISSVGGFKLTVRDSTIAGSAAFPLPRGIDFVKDSSVMSNVHFEDCTSGVYLDGVGHHTLTCVDGSSTGVTNLVEIAATFTGSLTMINCKRNGATNFLKDNRSGGLGTITGQDYEMLVISGALTEPNGLAAPNTAKAFATFDGTGAGPYLPGTAAMTAYFNITSIAKTGTGRYRVTVTNGIRLAAGACPFVMSNLDNATYTTSLVGASTFDIGINVATVATDSNEIKFLLFCN